MENDERIKKIKDPLYGYIEVQEWLMKYIDTPEFQRLRNIRQTGYAALYPGALHNRFVHSLGVFFLGNKAILSFRKNVEELSGKSPNEWDRWEKTFKLACLLHDVGHSPFSHTGEAFYETPSFRKILSEYLGIAELSKFGKPHEVMSAIVGKDLIEDFKDDLSSIDIELFVRCIIGAPYADKKQYLYENAIIQMLNGKIIDVDKIDYLVRDSYVTGYDTVNLDVDRLLDSYTILKIDGKEWVAYKHGALSVIENVAYANDLERRWIQTNPTVLYDCKLLEHAIKEYDLYMLNKYKKDLGGYSSVLCRMALSKEGIPLSKEKLRLLCDDDIIVYLKNISQSDVGKQYYERYNRLIPMWKNEIDFAKIIGDKLGGGEIIQNLQAEIARLTDGLGGMFFIDKKVKAALQKEHQSEIKQAKEAGISQEAIRDREESYKNNIKIFELFEDFIKIEGLPEFQFAIISSNRYESNYKKLALEEVYVELGKNRIEKFSNTLTVNSVNSCIDVGEKIFYVYTSRVNKEHYENKKKDIGEAWAEYVNENWRRVYEK